MNDLFALRLLAAPYWEAVGGVSVWVAFVAFLVVFYGTLTVGFCRFVKTVDEQYDIAVWDEECEN